MNRTIHLLGRIIFLITVLAQPVYATESIGTFTGYVNGYAIISRPCYGFSYRFETDDDVVGFVYCRDGNQAGQLTENQVLQLERAWHEHIQVTIVTDKYGDVISIRRAQ